MQLTQEHIENLKAYYRTHAESSEQPANVREAYSQAIQSLELNQIETIAGVEMLIDMNLDYARKCAGSPTLTYPDSMHRHSEKAKKFRPGLPDISSDRWIEQPDLPPCCHGDYREWHIEDGANYQEQLFCLLQRQTINPSGFSCEGCRKRRSQIAELPKQQAIDLIVKLVEDGQMTEGEALKLAEEYGLETA